MTTPSFATSKEAKEAGWISRRHEYRDSQDSARRYCPGGAPQTRAQRQYGALLRRQWELQQWKEYKADPQPDALGNTLHPHDVDYKIRCCKREIRCLKQRLNIEDDD